MMDLKELEMLFFKTLASRYKDIPVTPAQSMILMGIYHHDGELCQKELEKVSLCNKSTLSALLNTMEKNGLIMRKDAIDDSRKKNVVLSDKALEVVRFLQEDKLKLTKIIGEGITDEEVALFGKVLDKLKKNIERI